LKNFEVSGFDGNKPIYTESELNIFSTVNAEEMAVESLDLGENNLQGLSEKYDWAKYLKAGGWENVKIEDEGKSILIDNYKLKFPDYVKDINEIKLINPLVQADGSIKFEIQYSNGPIRPINDSFVTVLEEITPAVESLNESLMVREVFGSANNMKNALGEDLGKTMEKVVLNNDGSYSLETANKAIVVRSSNGKIIIEKSMKMGGMGSSMFDSGVVDMDNSMVEVAVNSDGSFNVESFRKNVEELLK